MKVYRHNTTEEYSTTVDWLQDFARGLKKESYNIEGLKNVRDMMSSKKTFNTIEEKMADIKSRIGFDLLKEMNSSSADEVKAASSNCACKDKKSSCSCKIAEASDKRSHNLEQMKVILRYIKDLISHEHSNLTSMTVISRCREEPALRFNSLPIDIPKLISYIDEELSKYDSDSDVDVEYIPRDTSQEMGASHSEAEYWSHAFPTR